MVGTVITKKGVALIAKLLATEQQLTFTRAAVGTGSCPSGYDPASMLDLGQYRMDGNIAGCEAEGEEATVTFQISSGDVDEGFIITEAGLFASDADDGEILYAYLDLTGDPQYVYAKGGVVQKFAEIDFKTVVGSVKNVTAVISPSSLVTREIYEEGMAKKVTTAGGDIADTKVSTYTAITEEYPVPAAGDTMKTIIGKVVKFILDAKTGFCRIADIVNNCTSTDTDKPLAAAQGKALWDKITAAATALTTHKSSGDHDGRYYTETEVNNLLAAKLSISNIVNNLTSTATNMALSAAQGKALNDRVNQLNSDLNTFSWKTLNADKWAVYAKYSHFVYLTINYGSKKTSNGDLLGILEDGYRPIWVVAVRNAFDNQPGEITINTDGHVKFESNAGDANYVRMSVMFIAQ